MGVRANITLSDGAATPVNRVYYPQQGGDNLILWRDYTQGVYAGQNRLSLSQRAVNKNARSNKISWKLECPVLEQIAAYGPSAVAYTNVGSIEMVTHERSTLQERKDMLFQMRDLIDEAIVLAQVQDLEFIF